MLFSQHITTNNCLVFRYNFRISLETESKTPTKSCAFTYSERLLRLFVQRERDIPIRFTSSIDLPKDDIEIRSFLMFKNERDQNEVVDSCPLHSSRSQGNLVLKFTYMIILALNTLFKITTCHQVYCMLLAHTRCTMHIFYDLDCAT